MAIGLSTLVEWWRRLVEWFNTIFTNKCEEKRAQKPPLKSKKTLRKEEKREKNCKEGQKRGEKLSRYLPNRGCGGAGKKNGGDG